MSINTLLALHRKIYFGKKETTENIEPENKDPVKTLGTPLNDNLGSRQKSNLRFPRESSETKQEFLKVRPIDYPDAEITATKSTGTNILDTLNDNLCSERRKYSQNMGDDDE